MVRRWVVNSSPLIFLGKIARIDLLTELCNELIIPDGVAQEIQAGDDKDPAKEWLKYKGQKWVKTTSKIGAAISSWDLGLGETHVLSWCYQNEGYEAILDDRAARKCAQVFRVPVRGTLGIILLAKKENHISEAEANVLIDKLINAGFRIEVKLLQSVQNLISEQS